MKQAVIYGRVSTDEQEAGQQISACRKFCEAKGWTVANVLEEKASAWKGPRPVWEGLKASLRTGRYDAVVVFRIDRAWRRASEFVLDFEEFYNRGVAVATVMEGIDASTPLGRAILGVIVAIAELERTAIVEATKQRLEALKHLNVRLGRPPKINDEEILATWAKVGTISGTARALGMKDRIRIRKVVNDMRKGMDRIPPSETTPNLASDGEGG